VKEIRYFWFHPPLAPPIKGGERGGLNLMRMGEVGDPTPHPPLAPPIKGGELIKSLSSVHLTLFQLFLLITPLEVRGTKRRFLIETSNGVKLFFLKEKFGYYWREKCQRIRNRI
jgi:hypothetical protein